MKKKRKITQVKEYTACDICGEEKKDDMKVNEAMSSWLGYDVHNICVINLIKNALPRL